MNVKILFLGLVLLSLSACYKVENDLTNSSLANDQILDTQKISLKNKYKDINFPLDSTKLDTNRKWIDLDLYSNEVGDLKLFYSGDDQARILSTTKKNIGNKEYLLALIAVNFNNYEGSGPAQVIFLSGGENNKENYKNTLFIPLGGFFPMLENGVIKFSQIDSTSIKDYCIQSFILNNDLSKREEMRCVGQEPNHEIKNLKFNSDQLGYDEI